MRWSSGAVAGSGSTSIGRPKWIEHALNGFGTFASGGWMSRVPTQPDRDERRTGAQREPCRPGVALVQHAVARTGALGEDAEQLAAVEHARRRR